MDVGNTEAKQKRLQIDEQINMLASSRERLSDRLINLSTRLSPALRDDTPAKVEDSDSVPDEQLVDIARLIREIRYYIESDTRQIINILDRLEI